jgi:hypothetical protein
VRGCRLAALLGLVLLALSMVGTWVTLRWLVRWLLG